MVRCRRRPAVALAFSSLICARIHPWRLRPFAVRHTEENDVSLAARIALRT